MVEQPDAHGKERGVDTPMSVTTKEYDWALLSFDSQKPDFLVRYEQDRNRCALSAEQIVNRALILGFTCKPYSDPHHPTCEWLASISPKGTQYVAETIEMCAFRWLFEVHPEVL